MKIILLIPILFAVVFGTAYSQQLSDSTGLVHRLDVQASGYEFEVQAVGNFDVKNHEFVKDEKRLTLFISSSLENNLGELIIPQRLLSGNFTFYLDDQMISPNNRQSEKISFVTLNFTGAGNHKLDVVASNVLAFNEPFECPGGFEMIGEACEEIPSDVLYSLEEIDEISEQKEEQCYEDYSNLDHQAECLRLVDAWKKQRLRENIQFGGTGDKGGCLIATATYGSELSIPVQQLRELRDDKLLQTQVGADFMNSFNAVYYSFSPAIADYERENPLFKEAVKLFITPMIASLSILNGVDLDSEGQVLGYGVSVILLNVGIYVMAPVGVMLGIRKLQK